MEWRDEGLILSVRPHGETSAIVTLLTAEHGRHAGLVRGGQSRRRRAMLQPGNHVAAAWRGRLAEQLGSLTLDPLCDHAATLLDSPLGLKALCSALGLLEGGLADRDPQPGLLGETLALFTVLSAERTIGALPSWAGAYTIWELGLLARFGFGLELGQCAATGSTIDLAYVSPKSGRAVSASAGAPWADRLLPLPPFLRPGMDPEPRSREDFLAALRLIGHFLALHHYAHKGQGIPDPRTRLVEAFVK